MFGREIKLEAIFTRVAGARDQAFHAVHRAERELIIAQRVELCRREGRENAERFRSLQRELRIALAGIFDFGGGTEAIARADVLEIAILV